jgi:hypothetical protein
MRHFAVLAGLLMLGGCALAFNPSASEVAVRTNPEGADCRLDGQGGFSAQLTSPASLSIPHSAAPVTVACQAPGYKRTVATLHAGASGWIWGNSALLLASGGIAVLGLAVDEATGANWRFGTDKVEVNLDQDRPRAIKARSRDGSQSLDLETR